MLALWILQFELLIRRNRWGGAKIRRGPFRTILRKTLSKMTIRPVCTPHRFLGLKLTWAVIRVAKTKIKTMALAHTSDYFFNVRTAYSNSFQKNTNFEVRTTIFVSHVIPKSRRAQKYHSFRLDAESIKWIWILHRIFLICRNRWAGAKLRFGPFSNINADHKKIYFLEAE